MPPYFLLYLYTILARKDFMREKNRENTLIENEFPRTTIFEAPAQHLTPFLSSGWHVYFILPFCLSTAHIYRGSDPLTYMQFSYVTNTFLPIVLIYTWHTSVLHKFKIYSIIIWHHEMIITRHPWDECLLILW